VINRVRTILVLGYRVLANTGRYWGGSGIGRHFFDCETRYRLPLTPPTHHCLLSKPQSNSSRRRAAATIQHNCLDLLANNSGRKSGVGRGDRKYTSTPVERSAFMTDWKDYRVSPLHHMQTVSLSRPDFSNRHGSVADVWQLARWATSPARQPCLAVSPVTSALR